MENLQMEHENRKKEVLIDKLLGLGLYKKGGFQLFEVPLAELEAEYDKLIRKQET